MLNVQEFKPENADEYNNALKGFSDASIYHTRPWANLLQATLAVKPKTLIAFDGKDIVGILPLGEQKDLLGGHRLVSLPFSHLVPPLGNKDAINTLLQYTLNHFRDKNYSFLEFKYDIKSSQGYQINRFMNTELSLTPDKNTLEKQLRPNTRQKLNQSLQNKDLSLRLASKLRDFKDLDSIMAINRRELGSLTYPKGFFKPLPKI